jgi:hypothetical protein
MKMQELNIQTSRLTIDIPVEFHRIVKAHATLSSNSIKDYVLDALKEKLKNTSTKTTKAKLKKTLNKRTASILASADKAKKVTFKDTVSAMKYLTK